MKVRLPRGSEIFGSYQLSSSFLRRTRRVSEDNHSGKHIGDDHGTSADHRALSNGDPRQNGGATAYAGTSADARRKSVEVLIFRLRVFVVGERHIGSNEDIILKGHAIPELNATFNRDAISDNDVVLNKNMRADIAVSTDLSATQYDAELPDMGPGTY